MLLNTMQVEAFAAEGYLAPLPAIDGPVTIQTPEQTEKASKYLADNWAKAVG